ncbi:Gtp binding protein [Mycena sanguinolenta]|uniref:Gtp binding protein n=1 Tax=Mycena sanguinolenta TaxID=230812 RepID=A0A8H6XRW6_9AGAR|nr:Gtp binding protein [Mycena sanguinolenta]
MEKKSSLPPSIQPFIWTRPQDPQGLSPTASSPGAQDEPPELPGPLYAPPAAAVPLPRAPAPSRCLPRHHPPPISRVRHRSGARTWRAGCPREAGRDPPYPAGRPQGSAAAYPGSLSLPGLSQITSDAWREGEAGPSSLVHSQPYGSGSRRPSPTYLQPIHRRATSPWPYSIAERTEAPPTNICRAYFPSRLDSRRCTHVRRKEYLATARVLLSKEQLHPSSVSRHICLPVYSIIQRQGTMAGTPENASNLQTRMTCRDAESPRERFLWLANFAEVDHHLPFWDLRCLLNDLPAARKLKCDGNRPACSNCLSRFKDDCKYEKEVKRRGPGKAAKGSRAQKPKARHSEPTGRLDDFDAQTIAPSLRPRASLPRSMYSSQNTLVESRYDSPEPEPVEPESRQPPTKKRRRKTTKREPSSEYYPENETKH